MKYILVKILLNSARNINSVNVDTYQQIELKNKTKQITEYVVNNVLSASDIFDAEREANEVYRIYGRIEYLSLLNGLKKNYKVVSDFFQPQTTNQKNIFNSFEFYLLKPSNNFNKLNNTKTQYGRSFEVIATPNDFDLYDAGFSKNVFGEQTFTFNFNKDYDISGYRDFFNFPITELFLYAQYLPSVNFYNEPELMKQILWNDNGNPHKVSFVPISYNVGDIIGYDLIDYNKSNFQQIQKSEETYYITTPYHDDSNNSKSLQWKYNPFIKLTLNNFSSNLNKANTGTTAYKQQLSIPNYATLLGDGNYVWRDILPQGFIDPVTGIGINLPFVNKRRYLFTTNILSISPDLTDSNTKSVFSEIKLNSSTILNYIPVDDLSMVGTPCQ